MIRPSGNQKWLQVYGVSKDAKDQHAKLKALGFSWDFRAFRWWGPNKPGNVDKLEEITGLKYVSPDSEPKPNEKAS